MYRRMGPNMETWKISKLWIAMDRVCTKATFISKGSYLNGEPKNVMAFGCNKRTERHGSANHKVSCYMCVYCTDKAITFLGSAYQ